jgi:hypothetical protein
MLWLCFFPKQILFKKCKILSMKKIPLFIWMLLCLFLMNSCNLDNLDFSTLSKEANLNPTLVAPLAKANITGWNLLRSANKEKDPSGLVKLIYRQTDIVKYKVSDFVNLPSQQSFPSIEKELGDISPEDISVSRDITLSELINTLDNGLEVIKPYSGQTVPFPAYSFLGPEAKFDLVQITDFTSVFVSGGNLNITLENKLQVPVTIKGSLFDVGFNRKIADFTFADVIPGGSSKKSVSLAGLQISNQVEFRMLTFETNGSSTPVNINLKDFLRISFELQNLAISNGNILVKSQVLEGSSGAFAFVFPEPEVKAFSAALKSGKLNIKTTNSSKLKGNISISLNEIKRNGIAIKANIPLNGNTTSVDLAFSDVNFSSDPAVPYNRIPYSYKIQVENSDSYIDYSSTDAIKLDITLTNLEFRNVLGDFGNRNVVFDPGTFMVDIFDKINGTLKVSNPTLSLILHNSIGMPAEVNLAMSASNKSGQTVSLQRNPPGFSIPVPADILAGTSTEVVEFNKQNSNIINFMALPPNGNISYSGSVDFNKNNVVTALHPNFFDDKAALSIDVAMDLPLELQINTLTFNDTSGITGTDFDKFENAELVINAKNEIPLDVEMQLFFVDTISKKQYGTSKKTRILSAAQVNNTGDYIPIESSQVFSLEKSDLENLRKSNGIVFRGTVISPAGENSVVTILSDSKIDMNVVIKSKLNL